MAISAQGRGGHPDHGMSGSVSGHSAGSGQEGALGGAAIGPDSSFGGPFGGYTGYFGQQYNQNMQNRYGQHQMHDFLQMMSQKYGYDSMKNFVDSYLNNVDIFETPSYAQQVQDLNFAPPGFGPSQGLGYNEGSGGNL